MESSRDSCAGMHVLALSDLHGRQDLFDAIVRHAPTADVVVLAGDLLERRRGDVSVREGQRECGEILARTLDPVDCPLLFIMGNDDMVVWDPPGNRFRMIHGRREEIGRWNFVGYQYSLPFMGGIHEKPEEEVVVELEELAALVDDHTVLVTHMPALGVLDETTSGFHAGSPSLSRLIEEGRPRVHIHGHIHCQFGWEGRSFNVAEGAMRIDVETVQAEVLVDPRPA